MLLLPLVFAATAGAECTCASACSDWCWVDAAGCPNAPRGVVAPWQSCDPRTSKPNGAPKASFVATEAADESFGERVYSRVSGYFPSMLAAKCALLTMLTVKFALSNGLDRQDGYWEDPSRRSESPWRGAKEPSEKAFDYSFALILVVKRFFYVASDVFFYVAVLTVFHIPGLYLIHQLWMDMVVVIASILLLVGLKASDGFCPEQKFVGSFWRLCEAKEGISLMTMTTFCLIAPPAVALMAHWQLENVASGDSDSLIFLFGLSWILFTAEYREYVPMLVRAWAICVPTFRGLCAVLGAALASCCSAAATTLRAASSEEKEPLTGSSPWVA